MCCHIGLRTAWEVYICPLGRRWHPDITYRRIISWCKAPENLNIMCSFSSEALRFLIKDSLKFWYCFFNANTILQGPILCQGWLHRFYPGHSDTSGVWDQILLNMDVLYLESCNSSWSLSPVDLLNKNQSILARKTYVTISAMSLGVWLEHGLVGLWDVSIEQVAIQHYTIRKIREGHKTSKGCLEWLYQHGWFP